METLIEKAITNGSPLLVLVIVVFMFLRYLERRGDAERNMFKEMHDQHVEARKESAAALRENAESTRQNTKAIQSLEVAVTRIGG